MQPVTSPTTVNDSSSVIGPSALVGQELTVAAVPGGGVVDALELSTLEGPQDVAVHAAALLARGERSHDAVRGVVVHLGELGHQRRAGDVAPGRLHRLLEQPATGPGEQRVQVEWLAGVRLGEPALEDL